MKAETKTKATIDDERLNYKSMTMQLLHWVMAVDNIQGCLSLGQDSDVSEFVRAKLKDNIDKFLACLYPQIPEQDRRKHFAEEV